MSIHDPTLSPLTSLHSQQDLIPDSPLSDDSLSSAGASTEPLPASEDQDQEDEDEDEDEDLDLDESMRDGHSSPSPSTSSSSSTSPGLNLSLSLVVPSNNNNNNKSSSTSSKQLAGGEDSDSSLTEQSSSEGEGASTERTGGKLNSTSGKGGKSNKLVGGRGRGGKGKGGNSLGKFGKGKGKARMSTEEMDEDENENKDQAGEEEEDEEEAVTPRGKQITKRLNYSSGEEEEEGEIHSDLEVMNNSSIKNLKEVSEELTEPEEDEEEEEQEEGEIEDVDFDEDEELSDQEEEEEDEEDEDESMNLQEDDDTTTTSNKLALGSKKSQSRSNNRIKSNNLIASTSRQRASRSSSLQSDREGEESDREQVLNGGHQDGEEEEEEDEEREEGEVREEEEESILPSGPDSRAPSTEVEELSITSSRQPFTTKFTRGKNAKGRGRGRWGKVANANSARSNKDRSRSTSVENQLHSESETIQEDPSSTTLASPLASTSTRILTPLPTPSNFNTNLPTKHFNSKKRSRDPPVGGTNGTISATESIADSSTLSGVEMEIDVEIVGITGGEESELELGGMNGNGNGIENGNGNGAEVEMEEDEEEVEDEEEEEEEGGEEEEINHKGSRKSGNSKVDKRKKAFRRKETGKEKVQIEVEDEEEEVEEELEEDEYAGSDHEEDNTDDFSQRKREEAMEALTRIEIEFARLRDRLYLERMADVERERIGVESGTHPDLLHLTQLIELRRTRKLELAKKWLEGAEGSFDRSRDADEHTAWTWWSNGRDELRTTMLEEAHSKRRKLEREKRSLDRPKEDGLSALLAPRPAPSIPFSYRRRVGFENDVTIESEIAWAMKQPDLRVHPSVSALDDDTAWTDLERMGLREPLRHANIYPFDSGYGNSLVHYGGPSFIDPRLGGFGNNSTFDSNPPQHHFGSSLPPLPTGVPNYQPQLNSNRVVSNPRVVGYSSKEQQQRPLGGTQGGNNRAYPAAHFPSAFDLEVERLQGQWTLPKSTPTPTAPVFQFDEIRRTNSNGSNGIAASLGDSIDLTSGKNNSNNNNHSRRSAEEPLVSENHGKPRFTLDEHMSRSPKPSPKTKVDTSTRINPSYMSIPAFVPNHKQQVQSPKRVVHPEPLPQPPVLPPMKQQTVEIPAVLPPLPLLPPLPSLPTLPNSSSLPSLPSLPDISRLPSLPALVLTELVQPVLTTPPTTIFTSLPELPDLPPVVVPSSVVPVELPILVAPSPLVTTTLFPPFSATTTQFPSHFPPSSSTAVNHTLPDLAAVTPSIIPVEQIAGVQ